MTLRYEADELPEYGAAVTKDGEEVGVLTSPTDSPRFGKIGLAVIASEQAMWGTCWAWTSAAGSSPQR